MGTSREATAAWIALMIVSTGSPRPAFASDPPLATLVLHVTDYQHVARDEMLEAQKLAARPYERIGIRLLWTDGNAREPASDGARHADVVVLTAEMSAKMHSGGDAFGSGSQAGRRAWIYYATVAAHARRTDSHPARALALALAHEIGHVVLPPKSHVRDGLMRASCAGRIVNIPNFVPAQAAAIRTWLTSPN